MEIKVGDKIVSKKKHACGGDVWTVERVGADVKIKCAECGRYIFVSFDEFRKMIKRFCDK